MAIHEDDEHTSSELSRQQVSIVAQLFSVVSSLRSIDELFQWLTRTIAQSFHVQLIQCWANSAHSTGEALPQLRTMICQDPSMPKSIMVNDQVLSLVQRLAREQRNFRPLPVVTLFSQYQIVLLRRHGLNYCTGCFLSANFLLPPLNTAQTQESTPFAMEILLFMRQHPHLDLASTVVSILEQAVVLAGNRGLLVPTAQNTYAPPTLLAPVPSTQYLYTISSTTCSASATYTPVS